MYLTPRQTERNVYFIIHRKSEETTPLGWLADGLPRCLADGESPDWQLAHWAHIWLGGWLLLLLSSQLGNYLYGFLADWMSCWLAHPLFPRGQSHIAHTETQSRTHLTFCLLYYALSIHQLPRVLLLMSTLGRCCSRYIFTLCTIHNVTDFPVSLCYNRLRLMRENKIYATVWPIFSNCLHVTVYNPHCHV